MSNNSIGVPATFYDPPSGWRFGFPKPYKPLPGESIAATLIRDGYPAEHATFAAEHCRFIGELDRIKELLDDRT